MLSFSTHVTARLLASLTAFLAAFLAFIAFVCDIALYAWVKHQVGKLEGVESNTDTAPGAFILPPFPPSCCVSTLQRLSYLAIRLVC